MAHDPEPQARGADRHVGNALAVVLDREVPGLARTGEREDDLARLTVLDRVVHRLLGDVVQVRRHPDVGHQDRLGALEPTGDVEQILDLHRPLLERGHEALCVREHRHQAAGQLAGLVDGVVHQTHDLGRMGRLGRVRLGQLLRQHLAHERDAGQVLAQPVVQVLADLALLPAADLEQRRFHLACAR